MSGVLIIPPQAIAAVPTVTGSGAANLRTPDPREIWIAPSTAALAMDIDLGAVADVDSFFLGSTNAHVAAAWTIFSATGPGTGLAEIKPAGPMRAPDSIGPRHHAFSRLAAPVTSRFFRIALNQAGAAPLQAGVLMIGRAFEKHREYGGGRTPVDTGARQDLVSGGFGIGEGVVKALFSFSFIDLSDAETAQLWAIKKDRGLRKPVLVVEDAEMEAGQNEAIHYGVFDRFSPYERQDPTNTRWAMAVLEWV